MQFRNNFIWLQNTMSSISHPIQKYKILWNLNKWIYNHLLNTFFNSKKRISGWFSSCTWFVAVFNPAEELLSIMESSGGAHTLCGSKQLQDFRTSAQKSSVTECWLPQSISMIQEEITCVNRDIIKTLIGRQQELIASPST